MPTNYLSKILIMTVVKKKYYPKSLKTLDWTHFIFMGQGNVPP